jgi:alkylglycerol monooxygenase
VLIALELAWGLARERNTYRLNDAINSIGLGMLSQISAVFTRLLRVGIYTAVYSSVALFPDTTFWTSWAGWLLALVFYDFCYYWLHRAGHEVAVFWAAHVVHHQSQDYNLSTACARPAAGALLGWVFYLPMAVAGVPPLVFGVVALVDLLYQFWVHTEHVGKLGWFDRWFCSPSNHRVHHAVNERYLDRNYGGILIIWDRCSAASGRRRALRLRHAQAAEQLGPAVGQCRGVRGAAARQLACAAIGATSCGCGSSRPAGGRPIWRRRSLHRLFRSTRCRPSGRR